MRLSARLARLEARFVQPSQPRPAHDMTRVYENLARLGLVIRCDGEPGFHVKPGCERELKALLLARLEGKI